LGTLTEDVTVATGDPVICECGAVFNYLSELVPFDPAKEQTSTSKTGTMRSIFFDSMLTSWSPTDNFFAAGDKVWTCEFCGAKRGVELEEEEKPKAESMVHCAYYVFETHRLT
jgi:hypothetical protein